jgi:hypothetical protein
MRTSNACPSKTLWYEPARQRCECPIYRRADGCWTAACYVLRPNGTRVRRAVYGKTRKDVADQLAVLITKTKAGLPLAVESWTLERFAEHWLTHVVGPRLHPSTLSSYRETLRLHVLPTRSLSAQRPVRVYRPAFVSLRPCSSVGVRMPASRALACQVWHPSMYGLRSVRSFRGGPGIAPPRPMSS